MPVEVQKKLGLAPGSVVEWVETHGQWMLRKSVGYTSEDLRGVLFPSGAQPGALSVEAGIRKYLRKRHPR